MRGRGHITIQQLSAETALHPHDIALAFMLLGFIKKQTGNKFLLSIDWTILCFSEYVRFSSS